MADYNNVNSSDLELSVPISGGVFKISRIEVVGDIFDDSGEAVGDGDYAAVLNAGEVADACIANTSIIAEKFGAASVPATEIQTGE